VRHVLESAIEHYAHARGRLTREVGGRDDGVPVVVSRSAEVPSLSETHQSHPHLAIDAPRTREWASQGRSRGLQPGNSKAGEPPMLTLHVTATGNTHH